MLQYAITDRHFFPGDERHRRAGLLAQAALLVAAEIDFLQLREKDLSPSALLLLAHALRAALPRDCPPRLLLNGSADLAVAARVDGLHLPGGWTPRDLDSARSAFSAAGLPAPTLSVTAHTLSEVTAACAAAADLILFGPVFEKVVRGQLLSPGVGLPALAAAVAAAEATPVLALGGVTPGNLSACLAAGAAGVAAIRLFLPPPQATPKQRRHPPPPRET